MKIEPIYEEGKIVYLRTDIEQRPFIVIGYDLRAKLIRYWLRCGVDDSLHSEYEITDVIDTVLKTSY